MLEGKGKIWKASGNGGHVIYVPADIVKDSQYPFKPGDRVNIKVEPEKKMIIVLLRQPLRAKEAN